MGGRCVPVVNDGGAEASIAMEAAVAEGGMPDAGVSDVVTDRGVVDTCVPMEDLPDPDGLDTNCDGIDGDAANAVFVVPSAGMGGNGSRMDPFHRVSDAIAMARGTRRQVLVAEGTYNEQLVLSEGVIVAGGYNPTTWRRSGRTVFSAPCPALVARNIALPTTLLGVDIVGLEPT
jgi:hypothetical protein